MLEILFDGLSGKACILHPNQNFFTLRLSNERLTNDYPFLLTKHVVCELQHFLPLEIQFLISQSLMFLDNSRRKTNT